MPSTVTVWYPFHPLTSCSLEVLAWPRHPANAATIRHPDGNPVKVPLWMLQPEAACLHLSEYVVLSFGALNALLDLLALHSSFRVKSCEPQGADLCSKSPSHSTTSSPRRASR